jgi:hypothetical protein
LRAERAEHQQHKDDRGHLQNAFESVKKLPHHTLPFRKNS